ncbi:hypothetical protein [Bounagaea algeriensis]
MHRPKFLNLMDRIEDGQVEHLLAIVHTFSCRLSGLDRYEKQLEDEFGAER